MTEPTFSFDWTDEAGTVLFHITGIYIRTSQGDNPWLHAVRQFAEGAAEAWKNHRLRGVDDHGWAGR